jgi:hypothetical protein
VIFFRGFFLFIKTALRRVVAFPARVAVLEHLRDLFSYTGKFVDGRLLLFHKFRICRSRLFRTYRPAETFRRVPQLLLQLLNFGVFLLDFFILTFFSLRCFFLRFLDRFALRRIHRFDVVLVLCLELRIESSLEFNHPLFFRCCCLNTGRRRLRVLALSLPLKLRLQFALGDEVHGLN